MFIKKKFFLVLGHSYETIKIEASCSYECDQNENLCVSYGLLCALIRKSMKDNQYVLYQEKPPHYSYFFFGFDKPVIIWCPCRKFRWMITFERGFFNSHLLTSVECFNLGTNPRFFVKALPKSMAGVSVLAGRRQCQSRKRYWGL